jgi:hypothetical protein
VTNKMSDNITISEMNQQVTFRLLRFIHHPSQIVERGLAEAAAAGSIAGSRFCADLGLLPQ